MIKIKIKVKKEKRKRIVQFIKRNKTTDILEIILMMAEEIQEN